MNHTRAQRTTAGSIGLLLVLLALACTSTPPGQPDTPVIPTVTPADAWTALLQQKPYPYAAPLPATQATVVDGTYTKVDPRPGNRAGCRRCPPYPPDGGLWKIRLDKGTFWVFHEKTAWHTQGSFTLSQDQIEFFNDPHCHQESGRYQWEMDAGQLVLEVIHDECGFGLRAASLTAQPWLSCQPPSTEAAISDHWQKPPGCD